jgi:hypothetical protein
MDNDKKKFCDISSAICKYLNVPTDIYSVKDFSTTYDYDDELEICNTILHICTIIANKNVYQLFDTYTSAKEILETVEHTLYSVGADDPNFIKSHIQVCSLVAELVKNLITEKVTDEMFNHIYSLGQLIKNTTNEILKKLRKYYITTMCTAFSVQFELTYRINNYYIEMENSIYINRTFAKIEKTAIMLQSLLKPKIADTFTALEAITKSNTKIAKYLNSRVKPTLRSYVLYSNCGYKNYDNQYVHNLLKKMFDSATVEDLQSCLNDNLSSELTKQQVYKIMKNYSSLYSIYYQISSILNHLSVASISNEIVYLYCLRMVQTYILSIIQVSCIMCNNDEYYTVQSKLISIVNCELKSDHKHYIMAIENVKHLSKYISKKFDSSLYSLLNRLSDICIAIDTKDNVNSIMSYEQFTEFINFELNGTGLYIADDADLDDLVNEINAISSQDSTEVKLKSKSKSKSKSKAKSKNIQQPVQIVIQQPVQVVVQQPVIQPVTYCKQLRIRNKKYKPDNKLFTIQEECLDVIETEQLENNGNVGESDTHIQVFQEDNVNRSILTDDTCRQSINTEVEVISDIIGICEELPTTPSIMNSETCSNDVVEYTEFVHNVSMKMCFISKLIITKLSHSELLLSTELEEFIALYKRLIEIQRADTIAQKIFNSLIYIITHTIDKCADNTAIDYFIRMIADVLVQIQFNSIYSWRVTFSQLCFVHYMHSFIYGPLSIYTCVMDNLIGCLKSRQTF